MRYIPNLIPEHSRVLKDYFRVPPYSVKKKNRILEVFGWLFGILFLINALVHLRHPLLLLILAGLGFLLLPPGHQWIEKKLHFRLTPKIKAIPVATLFVIAVPLTNHYNNTDRLKEEQLEFIAKKEEAKKKAEEQAEQKRKDSLGFYIDRTRAELKKQDAVSSEATLSKARMFALESDRELLEKEEINIAALKSRDLIKAGKYKLALAELNTLIEKSPGSDELLYSRALCYSKSGQTADAVRDCRKAMELGNEEANKLHEKINPIKKRVAYYVTRCCDGTTSNAKGRGACSHHGGVCDWNEPVYEEYRKYE
ncbi:hypothetical protein [Flavobacterium alkalisoli]|uniref:hypothetical protein n=1 Tax=Flavobacterium alkalisoli TaxID=2602769 RepID=UPI003A9319CA